LRNELREEQPREKAPSKLQHSSAVQALAYSPDGQLLAAGGKDGNIRLWRPSGEIAGSMKVTDQAVRALVFAPDGQSFAAGYSSGRVLIWKVRPDPNDPVLIRTDFGDVAGLAYSPDGKTLAVTGSGNVLQLFDVASGKIVRVFRVGELKEGLSTLRFSPDGQHLLVSGQVTLNEGTSWTTIKLLEVGTGKEVFLSPGPKLPEKRQQEVAGYRAPIAFSPDGKRLAGAVSDGRIDLLDPASGKLRGELTGHRGLVADLVFLPDGKRLVSGGNDRTLRVWDVETGKEVSEPLQLTDPVSGLALSPDGKRLAVGQADTVRVLDVTTLGK
jgi:WD40 repeat protein